MPFQRSTPEELATCANLVAETESAVRALVVAGKKVHVIWDIDHVLIDGRSDDVFALLGNDVEKYFPYEERLLLTLPVGGPWLEFARRRGALQQASQDVVTSRSSFAATRSMFFLLEREVTSRWELFIGHQPKSASYRIILESLSKDPDMHFVMVDDTKKHVYAFQAVAADLEVLDRCQAVLAPRVRTYSEEELRREVDEIMSRPNDTRDQLRTMLRAHDRTPR